MEEPPSNDEVTGTKPGDEGPEEEIMFSNEETTPSGNENSVQIKIPSIELSPNDLEMQNELSFTKETKVGEEENGNLERDANVTSPDEVESDSDMSNEVNNDVLCSLGMPEPENLSTPQQLGCESMMTFHNHFTIRRPSSSVTFRGEFVYLYELRSSQVQIKVSDQEVASLKKATRMTKGQGSLIVPSVGFGKSKTGSVESSPPTTRDFSGKSHNRSTKGPGSLILPSIEFVKPKTESNEFSFRTTRSALDVTGKSCNLDNTDSHHSRNSVASNVSQAFQFYGSDDQSLRVEIRDVPHDSGGYLSFLRIIYTIVAILTMAAVSSSHPYCY